MTHGPALIATGFAPSKLDIVVVLLFLITIGSFVIRLGTGTGADDHDDKKKTEIFFHGCLYISLIRPDH